MRLLIVDSEGAEVGRWLEVTGLGRGVDRTGRMGEAEMEATLEALAGFGRLLDGHRLDSVRVVATSASRDASNREEFFDRVERVLGVRPELISGAEEAALAYAGATAGLEGACLVVDVGGGSTEFVGPAGAVSIDIGSVRLTDRALPDRPATFEHLAAAARLVDELFERVEPQDGRLVGVAGTWTSVAAIHLGRREVHHTVLTRTDVDRVVERLAPLTVEETARLPGLDPRRAPVILAGAVVARGAMRRLAAPEVLVSERDLLDGIVASLG